MPENSEKLQESQNPPQLEAKEGDVYLPDKVEKRLSKVWDLRVRGISIEAISESLGVSISTIYADLKLIGKKYREEILRVDPLTLVAENLKWLDEMERVALFEVASSQDKKIKRADPVTGEMIEIDITDPNKSKFYIAALKAREMKLKLLMDTGVIPKEPEKMFSALESYQEHEVELKNSERTPEQISESIKKLLQFGRRL